MQAKIWPLWALAGALLLCLTALWWVYGDVKDAATRVGALETVNAANAESMRLLKEDQTRQGETLAEWQKANQALERMRAARAKTLREEQKHEDFQTWAGQPLPAGAVRVLRMRQAPPGADGVLPGDPARAAAAPHRGP